jgi:hypothetical protein
MRGALSFGGALHLAGQEDCKLSLNKRLVSAKGSASVANTALATLNAALVQDVAKY